MTISQAGAGQLRPSGDEDPESIIRVGPDRQREAILRLVGTGRPGDHASAERFLQYARASDIRLDAMWARLDHLGAVDCSLLAVPSPGRTAMVFASRCRCDADVPAVSRLIDHACGELAAWDVDLGQALLDPSENRDRHAFLGGGFIDLAELCYFERPLSRQTPPPPPRWPPLVTIERYRDALEAELALTLEQSYEQTLDCPGLYGLRRTSDIIAGHRATGEFDPGLWTLLRIEGRPAGAVLLNPFPGQRTVELVYLGLAPWARGRGLGRELLRHGLWLLRDRRERRLTLAVDTRNAPALALYTAEGMRPVVRRAALIRPLRRFAPR